MTEDYTDPHLNENPTPGKFTDTQLGVYALWGLAINIILANICVYNIGPCSQYIKNDGFWDAQLSILVFWLAGAFVSLIPPFCFVYALVLPLEYFAKRSPKPQMYYMPLSIALNIFWLTVGCMAMSV